MSAASQQLEWCWVAVPTAPVAAAAALKGSAVQPGGKDRGWGHSMAQGPGSSS